MAKRTLVLLAAACLATAIASTQGRAMEAQPDSKVLQGVPKVDFGSRFCSFPASLEAVTKSLGDPADYGYMMGVSGLAFRRLWSRDDGGNVGPFRFAAEKDAQAVALLGKAVATMERSKPVATGKAHMLEGLTFPKHVAAEMACVEGAVRYLGKDISAAWIYGGTGHAFAINLRPTVCVSSPYAWRKTLYELAPNLGFRVVGFNISKSAAGDSFPARQREAYDMVRAAIDRGQPCYADRVYWMPDYALITGYDDVGYYYAHSDDRGGPTPWQKLGTEDIQVLDVWRVELCDGKPDDQVVRAALETVLARAATPHGWTMNRDQVSGPWAFDLWADELATGHALRDSHAYNACFWAEYREMAVAFLEEAKRRLPGRDDAAFDEAIGHYRVVRDRLAAVAALTPNRDDANWTDTLCSPESAELVRQAGAEERQGLAALARIVTALGGTVPAPADPGPQETAASKRFVLQGVPKVAYYTDGRWRFTPFVHALDAALRYLGQPEQYDPLMCLSGAMFRMTWHPKAWDGGNSDILGMAEETLEPMRRAFRAADYEMRPVAKAEPTQWAEELLRDDTRRLGGELTDEAGFRRRIVESINAGRPVIAFGVVGPPEACLITGYDERGEVLIGWNVFQEEEKAEAEPSGYFRVRDWYPKTRGLLLFGDKVEKPKAELLDRETLEWALQVLRTPRVRDAQAGPAAFEAWAADMLDDASFPKDDLKVLRDRLTCHWDSMTVTATRGSGAATAYLLDIAKRHPAAAEELRAAADCLDQEDVVHGVAPGEEAQLARLADSKVRRAVADSILAARDRHVKAAEHLESALAAMGAEPAEKTGSQAAADPDYATGPLRVQTLPGFRYAYVSAETTDSRVAKTIHELAPKLGTVKTDGPGLVTYRPGSAAGGLLLEVGGKAAAGVEPAGEVHIRWMPPFRCASMLYTGSLQHLGEAIGRLGQAMQEKGLKSTGEYRELYLYWEDDQSPNNVMLLHWGIAE